MTMMKKMMMMMMPMKPVLHDTIGGSLFFHEESHQTHVEWHAKRFLFGLGRGAFHHGSQHVVTRYNTNDTVRTGTLKFNAFQRLLKSPIPLVDAYDKF